MHNGKKKIVTSNMWISVLPNALATLPEYFFPTTVQSPSPCLHACTLPFNHRSWDEDTAYAESLGLHRLLPSVLSPSPLLQRSGDHLYRRAGGAVAPLYW